MEEINAAVAALQTARDALIEHIDRLNAQREAVDSAIEALWGGPVTETIAPPTAPVEQPAERKWTATVKHPDPPEGFHDRKKPPTIRPSCGSISGAQLHYKTKKLLCDPCKVASREHSRAKRERKALKVTVEQASALIDDSAA